MGVSCWQRFHCTTKSWKYAGVVTEHNTVYATYVCMQLTYEHEDGACCNKIKKTVGSKRLEKLETRLTRKIRGLVRRGKNNRKLIENLVETTSGIFPLGSKLWPPGPKNNQILGFFRDWRTSLRITSIISVPNRARENPKCAFESKLNSPSQQHHEI